MTTPKITYANFIKQIVATVPELQEELDDHLETFGKILPHIFMGQLAEFVPESLDGSAAEAKAAERILEFLERGMASGDPKVSNAIVVSFLESLDPEEKSVQKAMKKFGPLLKETFSRMQASED